MKNVSHSFKLPTVRVLLALLTVITFAATGLAPAGAGVTARHELQHFGTGGSFDHYRLTVLGTLGGTASGANGGVNNRGQVAGCATLRGNHKVHAFLWEHGVIYDLGTLGGQIASDQRFQPSTTGARSSVSPRQPSRTPIRKASAV
jgi:probable HAF family extracellular repeat protein